MPREVELKSVVDDEARRRAAVERAGATGVKLLRADSGFWSTKVFCRLERAGWEYSIGVRMIKAVREVTSLGLEQAFLAITAEDDATNGHSAGETN